MLHLSERTLLRYEKEDKSFDTLQSQQIVELALLFNRGKEIFGDEERFMAWLSHPSVALSDLTPKSVIHNSLGIRLIHDELTRIEHGILA